MSEQLSTEEIFGKISHSIAEALAIKQTEVTQQATLFTDLGAESIDVVDIRFRIEEEFGFKVPHEELMQSLSDNVEPENITVSHLVQFIKKRQNRQ